MTMLWRSPLCFVNARVVAESGIADSLRHRRHEVTINPALAERARRAVTRMLEVNS